MVLLSGVRVLLLRSCSGQISRGLKPTKAQFGHTLLSNSANFGIAQLPGFFPVTIWGEIKCYITISLIDSINRWPVASGLFDIISTEQKMDPVNDSGEKKLGHAAETRAVLIKRLLELTDFFEVYHETVFRCFRKGKSGQNEEVTVTLYDAGKTVHPDQRYTCVARSSSGATATGNASRYADSAVENVRWSDLDK